ncbi:MAG: helix-turn-helix transcriptional regulator [Acutalibacteraceae bacterium]
MTATNKLKAKMVEVGITQAELAKILGISYQAMNYKINNRSEFKVSEIEAVADTLKIVNKDEYFFA